VEGREAAAARPPLPLLCVLSPSPPQKKEKKKEDAVKKGAGRLCGSRPCVESAESGLPEGSGRTTRPQAHWALLWRLERMPYALD
jgi:hypothetical protein